jgi:hypothetical protein
MSAAEQWEALRKELRQDADRAIAAATDQKRRDSIRSELTSFVRLPTPADDYELNRRTILANEHRTAWASAGKDSRMRDALFGRINEEDDSKDR